MTRPLRIEFTGAVYHITSRGNAKQAIFIDDEDKGSFLDVLTIVIERFNWLCHAYCLMENHYHLLIETPNGNLSKGMRELNGVYTQGFNQRYRRVGHLFQGRYKAIIVEKDNHLMSLCRYVVLNPLRVGLIARPEQWRWSSYRATIGLVKKPSFLTID
jgi:putative transposase